MSNSTALRSILSTFRDAAVTEREKGTYFEELVLLYLRHEPTFADLYSDVWLLPDVPKKLGVSAKDTGIDLVARTGGTGELHAIQCKFYAEDHRVQKSDIDSFFTASGKKPFQHRLIVTTTNNWSQNAEEALFDQQPPVTRIDLHDLESSQIDWSEYSPKAAPKLKPKYSPRPHQQNAIRNVLSGLKTADRGKLIMACGTGKTFTSLKIAEELAGPGKRVLFLVPSLALLSQTLTEWTQQSKTPLHSFAVCSDSEVGKKRNKNEDTVQTYAHELRYPATTNSARLADAVTKRHDTAHMSVVFSTYHSIEVIHQAQATGLPEFDLIICDEAHRTTGATFDDEEESQFVRIHDADYIAGAKRIYMTATPRVYANVAKAKAVQDNIAICSMDDESLYGHQLHAITFSEAVELDLLTDYKVIVLAIDEDEISARMQSLLKDENNQLKVDDAARIIGCWKALSKRDLTDDLKHDTGPMQRAVAFCQVIEPTHGKKTHKVSSKQISGMFQQVIDAYQASTNDPTDLICETAHVDGTMNATVKESKINWLKEATPDHVCRILSNVRCLSEGVDVPALDAVLFLSPRSSQVEVVQSVGRVMRKAPGKKRGYVILPVVIPHGMAPHEALNDNKVYKVVWDVLQALRSHDDRFDAFVNKSELIGPSRDKMEVIAVTDTLSPKSKGSSDKAKGKGEFNLGKASRKSKDPLPGQRELHFDVGEIEKGLYAKLVQKCGNRLYWEEWATDIAKIAQTHIGRIQAILRDESNAREIKAFNDFADELKDDLNDSITDEEVIEMLAQHLITKPVFDALFADYSFASNNPVSQGMQNILDLLHEHHLDKEADTLEQFYASVRRRADGIDKAEGKQKIVVELYDKFFRNAFPKMTERLGIVYTPVEVVDFIIHSVNDILQEEFGQTLGSEGVHILDPFVGTGTFITRLMQSGLITPEQLPHKYKHEIHCNEIVLLAYYIAAINIEAVYHSIMNDHHSESGKSQAAGSDVGGEAPAYEPFEGILLTDTFAMYESDDLIEQFFPDNSQRRKRQKKLDIRVIMANPPYSVGQENANDNNENVKYEKLDARIRNTYVERSTGNPRSLYDSYLRAIRWASDRVGDSGVIGLVTNAGALESTSGDGFRSCLEDEFSTIYIFHLRGNQRTSGEKSRQEGGKIFGSGSRAPIAIVLLVKNPETVTENGKANILWHDIGDYLSQSEKLDLVSQYQSTRPMAERSAFDRITPNEFNDWINQRDLSFNEFIEIGNKKDKDAPTVFSSYSSGVKTCRDFWCYCSSDSELANRMSEMIDFYNSQVDDYERNRDSEGDAADKYLSSDSTKISWSYVLKKQVKQLKKGEFRREAIIKAGYRPFNASWMYYDRHFNENRYLMTRIFPEGEEENLIITLGNAGAGPESPPLIIAMPSALQPNHGTQCFPRFLYESDSGEDGGLIDTASGIERREAITDFALNHFKGAYKETGDADSITKEDLFYYIYGLLHSPEYRERFKDNLSKELPRIPAVKKFEDFQAFSQAGRDLAHWHLDYETVDCHPVTLDFTAGDKGPNSLKACKDEHFYVRKMKFPKIKDAETGKRVNDKTTVVYNDYISVRDIPLEAYDYVVNGKSAIEWVMERQAVTTDKKSGITNDANLWATETMKNAAYPLELLQRIVTVSLETNRIVSELPKLGID